jgi:hypothetical protein
MYIFIYVCIYIGAYLIELKNRDETEKFNQYLIEQKLNHDYHILPLAYHKTKKWYRCNYFKITNSTIRFSCLVERLHFDHLLHIFEDYNLRRENIRRYTVIDGSAFYLLTFSSFEVAERVLIEKNLTLLFGFEMHLEHYLC